MSMSIKRRLVTSNAAIIVIPLMITVMAIFAYIYISTHVFNTDIKYENIKKLSELEYEFLKTSGSILHENPDKLLDEDFQRYLSARLSGINADIVILKNHDIVYTTAKLGKIDIEKCLNAESDSLLQSYIKLNGAPYIVKCSEISFQNGEPGWVILLSSLSNKDLAPARLLLFALVVFTISFILTCAVSALTLSRSLLQPLKRLQTAAGEISCGNLDYEVIEEGSSEIMDLCRSFEQMRLKLKESVYTQIKYDDNRKMLVSSISHDLKTPITSIKGYVEGIIDGIANTPEKAEKYLKTIYSKASQVDAMIDDLLLYSKLDLNQIPFNFEETDLVKYLEDSVIENEAELQKAGILLRFEHTLIEHAYVLIDRERMQRVVVNIIDNAKKYMNKPQGEIVITLREAEPNIIIQIRDNGAGIASEDLPYIFDRFYRADAARSKMGGSGLGLAIAKQIVEGHVGKIWLRSVENKGTSILISLKKAKQLPEGKNNEKGAHC